MLPKRVTVFAPATISNIGPGFDVLGLAIHKPGDIVTAERTRSRQLVFSLSAKREDIPGDVKKNVAAHVASLMMEELNPPFGIALKLDKRMPVGSGLGSSAASSVAAAVAVNALLPKPLNKTDLLRFVVEGERLAAGSPHADNAAPSLLGGACLIRSYDPLDVISLPIKNSIVWVVVHPHCVVGTAEARALLPQSISLRAAIRQWGNVSGVTAALIAGDTEMLGRCLEDTIIEPVRAKLIPGFARVKESALRAGAFGCSISGSGPSMFAIARSVRHGREIASAMMKAFARYAHIRSDAYLSRVNMEGATIISERSR